VAIENTSAAPLTITSVGIWFSALSTSYDFGPSRISKHHPFPGYTVTVAPGESVTYSINVGEIYNALIEKQDQITDFLLLRHHRNHHPPLLRAGECRGLPAGARLESPGLKDPAGRVFQA
jgi:hypothetical protein